MKAVLCALVFTPCLTAQGLLAPSEIPVSGRAFSEARKFRSLVVQRVQNSERVRQVRKELRWHPSAQAAAQEAVRVGRPIFMVQALGSLRGLC